MYHITMYIIYFLFLLQKLYIKLVKKTVKYIKIDNDIYSYI